eukprot:TRINITY_DN3178_c0_g1_i1.p2 TRINITY_DN3178_c0_g1~~TRINITY_DN3178_c0_g1_i1.p2  ORF type:complete len:132 (-),score=23.68 TRINITY_DN3178_c0_g1_i1:81-476(-)
MNPQPAFVSSFTPSLTTTSVANSFLSSAPVRPPRTVAVTPCMALETKEKPKVTQSPFRTLEANRAAKVDSAYRGLQGFTPYAEKVNGRLAQLGFVIALVTELVSGKGINEQILIMFSPLIHVVESLAKLAH